MFPVTQKKIYIRQLWYVLIAFKCTESKNTFLGVLGNPSLFSLSLVSYQFVCAACAGLKYVTVATASKDQTLRLWKVIGRNYYFEVKFQFPD